MPAFEIPRQRDLSQLEGFNGQTPSHEVLEGVVEDIIFRNENNGYAVLSLAGPTEQIVVGVMPYLSEGEYVRFYGSWTRHPDYGRQFSAEHYELRVPGNQESILQYLSSGIIKGVGEKSAKKLFREFGQETLDILRDNPERVAKIKGFSLSKARSISDQLQEKRDYQELVMFLTPLGISQGKILRIYKQFGREAMRLISENPFRLADEVYGIGFTTADDLARSMGLDPDSPHRVASAIKYILYQSIGRGHTYLPAAELAGEVRRLLNSPIQDLQPILQTLQADHQICLTGSQFGDKDNQRVALANLFRTERSAADRLLILKNTQPLRFDDLLERNSAEAAVEDCCAQQHMTLAPEQLEALTTALQSSVMILTGGPGTGKTTIIRLLCDCITRRGGRVLLAAPTGRAARRMTETTGIEAKTLHRLLELQFVPEASRADFLPSRNTDTSLSCELLIVDEMSMVDVFLLKSMLEAISPGTRLVLVGDADQLPSVGPGYVLKDLIESQKVPVVRLTQIFRQSSESLIIRNAHRINEGLAPTLDQSFDSQCLWVFKETPEEIADAAVKLCNNILPQQYGLDPLRDVQVLTPLRKGPAGTVALNRLLQKALQSRHQIGMTDRGIEAHGSRFFVGDKVMQTRNNYDIMWRDRSDSSQSGCGVFNGESGTVQNIQEEDGSLEVLFDDERVIEYDRMTLEDLDLAYAITIHKSQGSEYSVVVLAVPTGAPQLLTRNLLYTAVTRARNKLILVASRRTIASMLANNHAYVRYTMLKDWLQQPSLWP